MPGMYSARILKRKRKRFRWKKTDYKSRKLKLKEKRDPLAGSAQAKGIVLEKRQIEAKQPHSGLLKCVRVQLVKNGKQITAFCPGTGAINQIKEHDEVLVEGIGGSKGGPKGSLPSVKWKVIQVNGVSLDALLKGKAKRKQ